MFRCFFFGCRYGLILNTVGNLLELTLCCERCFHKNGIVYIQFNNIKEMFRTLETLELVKQSQVIVHGNGNKCGLE